jgi:hypothetical protein
VHFGLAWLRFSVVLLKACPWLGISAEQLSVKASKHRGFRSFFLRLTRNADTLFKAYRPSLFGIGRPNCSGSIDFCG